MKVALKLQRPALIAGLLASLGLAGCNGINPLNEYVEETVKLEASKGTVGGGRAEAHGALVFTKSVYYTAYETACDTIQCGYDHRQVCDYDRVCSPGRRVCVPTGTPVCRIDANGRRHCNTPPGGGQSCHYEPGECRSVRTHCRMVSTPRYCPGNCREIPVTRRREVKIPSAVIARVHGVTAGDASDVIEALVLGVKTNRRFQLAVMDPSTRPKALRGAFEDLKISDKTVLALKAKGHELVPGQEFLRLPHGFKPGDVIELDVSVRPSASGKSRISATGSEIDLPAVHFRD